MKKSYRLLIILLAVLILLVGVFAVVSHLNRKPDTEPEPAGIRLNTLTDAEYITITKQGKTWEFKNSGDTWTCLTDKSIEPDPTKIAAVKQAIVGLTATRELEATDELSSYGLGDGDVTVSATDHDGHTFTLEIGNPIPAGEGNYARYPDDDKVYVIATTLPDALDFEIQ